MGHPETIQGPLELESNALALTYTLRLVWSDNLFINKLLSEI